MQGISGLGVDIVDLAVLSRARFLPRVAEYFLTPRELEAVPVGARSVEYIGSRFALKEAVIKACPERLSPFDFSIEKMGEKPQVVFAAADRARTYGVLASLSHTPTTAAAIALVYQK
jgi:holo-[acyl-carrier-protein] synthase